MARNHVGRHRAPSFNPLNEIAEIASRSAQPAMKASAVVVASGGLIASFAIPSYAASSASVAAEVSAAEGVARPASVTAPAVDPSVAPAFGLVGFTVTPASQQAATAVVITKIAPAVSPAVAAPTTAPVSRSSTRSAPAAPTTTTTKAPAPAAAPTVAPAPTGGIVGIATSLFGIPYVWGGTTTRGFDCAGYTQYVYRLAGVSIPRTANAQQAAATKVSSPVPGDLVFFGYPAYHVGIYAGNGQIYAAQHTGTRTGLFPIWTTVGVSYGRF